MNLIQDTPGVIVIALSETNILDAAREVEQGRSGSMRRTLADGTLIRIVVEPDDLHYREDRRNAPAVTA